MPAAAHPSPADLEAFALGTLPDGAHAAVESHLAECPSCLAAAAAAPDDTLVGLLRSAETSQAGPVTPGTGFAETVGLSQPAADHGADRAPPELANHPRYRVIRPLGRGGMGHVWLAEHTVMGRPVALKLVRPEFLDRPEAIERFRREVKAAARLGHPNIVAAHDAEQAGGTHFLVMEYIDGETLAERVEAGPVAVEDACRWVIDAARGLEHAWVQGLIHRDVKPHNLIRERATGRVKVLDFGLAGVTAAGEASGLTGGNVVIGTPDYIAPEQAMDARRADTRSDVYSLGCTLYHLLAGRPPFAGDTVLQKIDAHRSEQPAPLTAIRQDMTPALAELVARMMAKDPKDRPQTPGEVAVALEDLLAGRGGEPPVPGRRRRDDGAGERGRRWLLRRIGQVAVITLGVLVGAVVYKLTDKADISVSNEAPDQVKWVIKKDGYIVSEPSSALLTSFFLPAGGEYTVELDRPDEFVAFPKSFAVRRGEDLKIRIVRVAREPQPAAVGPTEPGQFLLHGKPDAPFTELMPYLDPSLDREAGALGSYSQAYLTVASDKAGPARVAVPARPEGDYEFRARIARVSGDGSFNLILPVPGTDGRVQMGVRVDEPRGRDGLVTFDWPGGPDAHLVKSLGDRLRPGTQHLVLARVTRLGERVRVAVVVNGVPVIEWTGEATEDRNGRTAFTRDRRQVGFGATAAEFRIDRLEFRVLNGTADLSRRPAPEPTAGPAGPGLWVDLLKDLKLPVAISAGTWGWSGGSGHTALVGGGTKDGKPGRLALSAAPRANYELRIRFQRIAGDDGLIVLLPIPGANRSQTPLIVDGYPDQGGLVGLVSVKEKPVTRPARDARGGRLRNMTTYTLHVAVASRGRTATVRAEIDNTPAFDWTGPIADLTPNLTWFTLGRNEIGLGVPSPSQFRVESVEFRRAGRPDPATAPRAPGPNDLVGRPDAPWTDLLGNIDLYAAKVDGPWGQFTRGSDVTLWAGHEKEFGGRLALPVRPHGDYEFRLRLARTDGADGLAVLLPVPDGGGLQPALVIDGQSAAGGTMALESVNKAPVERPTTEAIGERLVKDRPYTLVVRVERADGRATIRATLGPLGAAPKTVLDWTGPVADLTPNPAWATPDRSVIGLRVADHVRFKITAADVRMLTGTAERLAPAKAAAAEPPGPARRPFARFKGLVHQMILSPDGAHAYAADDEVVKWDVATGETAWVAAQPGGSSLALSGDGKVLTVWAQDGTARVLDPATGQQLRQFPIPKLPVRNAVLNKDGTRAFVSQRGNEKDAKPVVAAWDVVQGKELFKLDGITAETYGLALSPDGTRLATGSYDKSVKLWDALTGKVLGVLGDHAAEVSFVTFSADGQYVASGGGDNLVRVWNVEKRQCVSVLIGHTTWVLSAAFTPDGSRLVTGAGYDGKGDGVRVWDWRTGAQPAHFPEARGMVNSVAAAPGGRQAVTAEDNGQIRVWRLPPPPAPPGPDAVGPVRRFGWFQGGVPSVALSEDGKYLYALDKAVAKWDRETEAALWHHPLGADGSFRVAATADDKYVVVGCSDGTVRVLDAVTGRERRRFTKHAERIIGLAISPDGRWVASSSGNHEPRLTFSVRVWNIETAAELCELKGTTDETWGIRFSRDGNRVATASDDGKVRLWDAKTGALKHTFSGHRGMASVVAFSPDGKRLASGGQDLFVHVWDVENGVPVRKLEGHATWVTDVAFTPDGTRIVSVGSNPDEEASDGVWVWDAAAGTPLYRGAAGRTQAVGLAVGPDGRYAVTGGIDGALWEWRLPEAPKR